MKDFQEDNICTKRRKGSDKARERFERNGTYSSKHLRISEEKRERQFAEKKRSKRKNDKLTASAKR
tara:strand:+ start:762 stop:959 length:198 start_codon:yes stop_codon:yes gene_type:complete